MLIPSFSAWSILGGVIILLLLIRLSDRWINRRVQRTFSAWARNNRVRYSPVDRFQLAARIQEHLPHPAAADVVVRDVMYRTDDQNHLYLFTARYRIGTVSGQKWIEWVGAVQETRCGSCDRFDHLQQAEPGERLFQYASLLKTLDLEDRRSNGSS